MKHSRIIAIFAALLFVQAWCKPGDNRNYDDYPGDKGDDDYDDGPDDSGNDTVEPSAAKINSKPVSLEARAGSTVVFPCDVSNADNVAVIWKKGDYLLYSDDKAFTSEPLRIIRMNNNSLEIHNVTPNDTSDNYICQFDEDRKIVHRLHVDEEAQIVRVLPNKKVQVAKGGNVTLGCEVRGYPTPEIKWSREGKRLPTGEDSKEGQSITIYNVTRHHAGLYQCLAENRVGGKPAHAAIDVIVHFAPEIEIEQETVHTGTGIESELTCTVHGHPHAKVTWYKGGKEVPIKEGKTTMKVFKSKHTLVIAHTMALDLGEYTCSAENKLGLDRKSILLSGAPMRAKPVGGEVAKDGVSVILKWNVQSYSPITEYKLEYRRKGESEWQAENPRVADGKGNVFWVEHPLRGLQQGSYEAILFSRNDFGWSPKSQPLLFNSDFVLPNETKSASAAAAELTVLTTLFLVIFSYACTYI